MIVIETTIVVFFTLKFSRYILVFLYFPCDNFSQYLVPELLVWFSANVIHDMQVLGLVHTKVQQAMKFLSEAWSNMAHKCSQC